MFLSARKSLLFLFLLVFSFSLLCAENSASAANRRTAIRYLKLSEQYAADKNWQSADSSAELGLSYDSTISDLWYIRAVSRNAMGIPKYNIIPLIQNALASAAWVDYNKDSARVFYADILCATREFDQALAVLDGDPFVYSADAEYIRAKAYYNIGGHDGIEKARNRIDATRRVYPDDKRFPELFFRYEYSLGGRNEENARLSDSFLASFSSYKNPSSDLEIYAALFAEGEDKVRMLKSFNARNLKSPLYAVAAIDREIGLMSETDALDYFYQFSDESVDYSVLVQFARSLSGEETVREFGEYLNQYDGTLLMDTDGDLIYNLVIEYSRGRPQKITYDSNQDDLEDWSAECDFGSPYLVHLTDGALDIDYGSWPSVSRVVYKGEKGAEDFNLAFNLVAETLLWSPFSIAPDSAIKDTLGVDFFIPAPLESPPEISGEELMAYASSYEMPSKERKGAIIRVSLLDGKAQIARYYADGLMYAQTMFQDGLPAFRTVDMDGDGLFETTETYGFDRSSSHDYISENDELQIMTNLFGQSSSGTGFYIKTVQVDRNGDTIPDYMEEYTKGLGKTALWDLDSDGKWDVRYEKFPKGADGSVEEESSFYLPPDNSLVAVRSKDGVPVSVSENGIKSAVVKSADFDVYWIGEAGEKDDAEKVIKNINQNSTQGVSIIVENNSRRMMAIRIGQYIFARILPYEQIPEEKVEDVLR